MLWPPERQSQRRSCGTVRDVDRHETSDSAARLNARVAELSMTDKSDPSGVPSAPPNPCSTRVWTETGDKSDTTLLHTASNRPSKKRSLTIGSGSHACSTTPTHTPSKRLARPSQRSPDAGRRQSSGLIVRGSTYYLRLRVPRPLAGIIGKTHVMKSLGTGYRAEAVSPTSVERQVYRSNRTVAATLGPRSQICFVRQDR